MKKTFISSALAALLCFAVLLCSLPLSAGAAYGKREAEKKTFVSRLTFDIPDEKTVRAIVVYGGAQGASSARAVAPKKCAALDEQVCALGGRLVFRYGALIDGVAVEAKYADLKRMERLGGVKAVYLSNSYAAPCAVKAAGAAAPLFSDDTSKGGGNGAVVAVLDTSFNVNHEAFSADGVEEALTKSDMQAIRDGARGTNGKGVYVSAKIPFAYDYADRDTLLANKEGHGTAVAGIAVGNNGSDYKGAAPNAQLLCMKIFSDADNLTDSSVYFAALEDAYLLGADAVNMSLGSPNGFSYDSELESEVFGNIYKRLRDAGVFVFGAAGNEYSQGRAAFARNWFSKAQGVDAVTASYADYGVLGSPASYSDVVAVGSFRGDGASGFAPSGFSSWGCTPDLKLKPEISAVGENVNCPDSSDDTGYFGMSGTSMATPAVTGSCAALKAYFSSLNAEPYRSFTARQMYDCVYGELLSHAERISGVSPRKQGAGLVRRADFGSAYFENPVVSLGDDADKSGIYSFQVSAKSLEAGVPLTLKDAELMCDSHTQTENGLYNTLTARRLSATVETDSESYVLSQSPSVVTVTVRLSDEAKRYLDVYPNGGFVEGYIDFSAGSGGDDLHLTLMGFYGDWGKAPAFESYDWGDVINTEIRLKTTINDETGRTYAEEGLTYEDILETDVGVNEGFLLDANGEQVGIFGDNFFGSAYFDAKRLAFSTGAAKCGHSSESFVIYPALLRNLRRLVMTVRDAETNEVYYVDDTEYPLKDYYNYEKSAFEHVTYFTWDGTFPDGEGGTRFAPNDTRVLVTFETQIDFAGAPLVKEREYTVFVDFEAPDVTYSWDAEAKKLEVSAMDNQYLSYVSIFDAGSGTELAGNIVSADAKNERYTAVFDLSNCDLVGSGALSLTVYDYATNYTRVNVPLTGAKGDVNGDGAVDNIDASVVLAYDAGALTLTDDALRAADVNGDGIADNLDAAVILKYDAGLSDKF